MSDADITKITPELIADFRARKILSGNSGKGVELDRVSPGEKVVGNLTAQEMEVFEEIVTMQEVLDDWGRDLQARSLELVANATRASERPQDVLDKVKDAGLFKSDDEAEAFFRDKDRFDFLWHLFWWNVRTRYSTFGLKLGVRSGGQVVTTGKKYLLTDSIK